MTSTAGSPRLSYHSLSWDAFTAVLDMLSGKYPSAAFREFPSAHLLGPGQ